jgi:transposase-like protein
MKNIRKKHGGEFKVKVALAAIKGDKTIAELVKEFGVHESQIYQWKNQLLNYAVDAFSHRGNSSSLKQHENEVSTLHEKIGQLVVERDFLKKVLGR